MGEFWSFEAVEDRLIEAMDVLRRSSDKELGWLHVGSMGLWRQVRSDNTEAPVDDRPITTVAVTRAEVTRADEALGWVVAWVPSGDTRKILGISLMRHAGRGSDRSIWPAVWAALGGQASGWTTEGLRKRYGRALNGICVRLNRAVSSI